MTTVALRVACSLAAPALGSVDNSDFNVARHWAEFLLLSGQMTAQTIASGVIERKAGWQRRQLSEYDERTWGAMVSVSTADLILFRLI